MSVAYLSTTYFGPVQYYCKFLQHDKIFIEQYENYLKQTFRNRFIILGPNSLLKLSIPIEKGRSKMLLKDARIAYTENWQKNHFIALESAYRSSPYFEYYIHEFDFVFNGKEKFLLDLNLKILDKSLVLLNIANDYALTEHYSPNTQKAFDYRYNLHPKTYKHQNDESINFRPYWQVFGYKFNFMPNLSILDVFFNLGVDSQNYLKTCLKELV